MRGARVTTRVPLLEVEQANVLAQAARDCLEMGWQPIPIPARSKNPGRDDWQLERWTLADVAERFAASNNIGVLTGEPSHGLTDVDLDCEAAIRCAPSSCPKRDSRAADRVRNVRTGGTSPAPCQSLRSSETLMGSAYWSCARTECRP